MEALSFEDAVRIAVVGAELERARLAITYRDRAGSPAYERWRNLAVEYNGIYRRAGHKWW